MKISEIKNEIQRIREEDKFRSITDFRMISATKAVDRFQKEYLVFSSNNYLGLSHEKEVIEAAKNALEFGTASTGARLISGANFELSELEKNIADFKKTEAALVFNTGYMTNLGVLYALLDKDSVVFSDELNHASIIDGIRISRAKVVVYPHNDIAALEKLIREENQNCSQAFVISDGVFSMDGDIVNLPALVRLKKKYHFCLIIDEAHALGTIGKSGHGTLEHYGLEDGIDIQIGTLSKTLASEGGYVACSKEICDFLINRSRPFIFSTALPPSVAAAANAALRLLKENGEKYARTLHANTNLMRTLLKETGVPIIEGKTPIIPIIVGDSQKALVFAKECREKGILLTAVRPPSVPEGSSRIRLTISAAHSELEIKECARTINDIWRKL